MADSPAPLIGVERVLALPDQFKRRLAISENAYTTRRAWRSLTEL